MSEHDRPADSRAPDALPEGEEAAPAGVRTMALVRWALVALMAVAAAGAWISWADLGRRAVAHAVQYRCPMHPSVIQGGPGECPICGMDLVVVEGRAPPLAPVQLAAATAPAGKLWCPMHPEVTSDDPAATCSKCGGMKLVPRPGPIGKPGGPVPGLAPVEIGADRTQLMGMRTARVTRQRLAPQLRTVGFVSANEASVAIITARFTGWIEELPVAQSGQHVEKGQVLATVYSPDLLSLQQVFLNALKWSKTQGAAATATEPRRRLELLGVARQDLDDLAKGGQAPNATPLRSPVAGYVAKKAALPGLYVQPGTELFQVADLSTVWVVADVYEHDMSRIHVGQRARLLLAAYPGEAFTGHVQFIYPAVNPESRTLQARMQFKNPGLKLRPGMYGDVVIELASAEGLSVPTDAVVDTGELQYVFLARDRGRFEPRVVRLGARGDGRVQILDGLADGDVVVTTANFLVDSESRLRAAVEGFGAGSGEPPHEHDEARERQIAGTGRHDR